MSDLSSILSILGPIMTEPAIPSSLFDDPPKPSETPDPDPVGENDPEPGEPDEPIASGEGDDDGAGGGDGCNTGPVWDGNVRRLLPEC
jgi:hypothetical protein